MYKSTTYQFIVRASVLLLLAAFSLPSGLHAKQLVDYCFNSAEESRHFHMTEEQKFAGENSMQPGESGMLPDHSCCPSKSERTDSETSDADSQDDAAHKECGWGFICTCHMDQSFLADQNWTLPGKMFVAELAPVAVINPDSQAKSLSVVPASSRTFPAPPIFLLNSTFLN